IKGMFWRNNIVGFAPMLPVTVNLAGANTTLLGTYFAKHIYFGKQDFVTGVRTTHPWWRVEGEWPDDNPQKVLLGERLAAKMAQNRGNQIKIADQRNVIFGIFSPGAVENNQFVASLSLAKEIIGKRGAVRQISASALPNPKDAFARRDPA